MNNEINDSNVIKIGERNWEYLVLRHLHCPWIGIVLFESELGLQMQTLQQPQKNFKYNWYAKRGEKKESYKSLN